VRSLFVGFNQIFQLELRAVLSNAASCIFEIENTEYATEKTRCVRFMAVHELIVITILFSEPCSYGYCR